MSDSTRRVGVMQSVVSLLITAALLVALFAFVDVRAVVATLARISPIWFVAAFVAAASNLAVSCMRYRRIQERISGMRVSLWEIAKIDLLTSFCTYFLPVGAAADGVRVVAARDRLGISAWQAFEGVVHDRILAAVGLALCLVLAAPLQLALGIETLIVVPQVTIATALLLAWPVFEWFGRRQVIPSWSVRIVRLLTGSPIHVADVRSVLWQLLFAIVNVSSFALTLILLARGMAIDLSPLAAIAFAPVLHLAQVLPFLYGGFGAREAVAMATFAGAGAMTAESAVSLSLAVGICNLAVALPGALVGADYLTRRRIDE